jgi:hypothetical protein
VRFLNINDRLADEDGRLVEGVLNERDKLHPTLKGYQIWADALKPIFQEILGPPAATDLAPPPTGDPIPAQDAPTARTARAWLPWAVAALVTIALAVTNILRITRPAEESRITRFAMLPPPGTFFNPNSSAAGHTTDVRAHGRRRLVFHLKPKVGHMKNGLGQFTTRWPT